MSQNLIISTSINPPTEAIKKFDKIKNWELIVVGDKKLQKNINLKMDCISLLVIKKKLTKNFLTLQVGIALKEEIWV